MSRFSRTLRSAALMTVALSVAGCGSMLSGDPFKEEFETEADKKPVASMTSVIMRTVGGVNSETQQQIQYKPRAPLAMPPAMELRTPESPKDMTAEMPNWPKDNNEKDEYIASINEAKSFREKNRDDWENPVMPGREMARYRVEGGGQVVNPEDNDQGDDAPEMDKEAAEQFAEDVARIKQAQADGVAKRRYLIDPPAVYRTPAGNAPLPSQVELPEQEDRYDDWENPTGY
ncbi:MAG: hypothetical protein AAGF59_08570 [Pseudomonadota bacterium]